MDWSSFVYNRWHLVYERLAFRKLRGYPRTLDTMQRLEIFIKEVIGKKYKLSASKIFNTKRSSSNNEGEEQSFFCSELIASAYKSLDLLPSEIAASQYWPGTFAEKSGLQLSGSSAYLDDEQILKF